MDWAGCWTARSIGKRWKALRADNRMKDMELGNGFVSKVDFVDLRRDSAMFESEL